MILHKIQNISRKAFRNQPSLTNLGAFFAPLIQQYQTNDLLKGREPNEESRVYCLYMETCPTLRAIYPTEPTG